MPEVVQGIQRRPAIPGRTLFDYADEVSTAVPASCQRTGRCRECAIHQFGDAFGASEFQTILPVPVA